MDQSLKRRRNLNPGLNVNFFSRITFFFVLPTLFLSRRRDFSDKDVYEPLPTFSSRTLGNKLKTIWNLEKIKENPSLCKALFKMFGLKYIFWGLFFTTVEVVVMIVTLALIGKIVVYFSSTEKLNQDYVVVYVVLLTGSIFLRAIMLHSYKFLVRQLALKTSIACSTLIYQKALKVNTFYMTNDMGGRTVTLITKDLDKFDTGAAIIHQVFIATIKIMVMTYTMYKQIGVSAFIGIALMIVFMFLQALLSIKTIHYRLKTAKKTDKRIQMIQEVLATISVIKMYTWELFFSKSIDATRRKEVKIFQIVTLLKLFSIALGLFNKRLSLYTCFVTFVAFGNVITAEKAFIVVGCFATLGLSLNINIPVGLVAIAEVKATLIRITKYLLQDEVMSNKPVQQAEAKHINIVLKNVTVKHKNQVILKDINLVVKPGITIITGTIGSGKSTLLKTILGETEKMGTIEILGEVSYASQEPWLFPGTIKQNIIFKEAFNKTRYNNVLRACALQKDLESFKFGDETMLTDKGLNLSQGQKYRINLARAVYKSADIYLLDECLSAVDVQVGRHIFQECIKNFLCGKVCFLVSHLHPFIDHADTVVFLNKGLVEFKESYSQTKQSGTETERPTINIPTAAAVAAKECNKHEDAEEDSTLLVERTTCSTRNAYHEIEERGSIKTGVYYKYLSTGGIKLILTLLIVLLIKQVAESWADYFVRFWVDSELKLSMMKLRYGSNSAEYEQARVFRNSILSQYSLGLLASALLIIAKVITLYLLLSRTSIRLHRKLIDKIINAAMPFFGKNLAGNIVNKFSRDMNIVDERLPYSILDSIELTFTVISVLLIVITVNPWFLLPSVCFAFILYIFRRLYIRSGRNIRRVEGSVRSPVIGHMQATFDGLTTIRALGAQEVVKKEFDNHLDVYNSVMYMHLATVTAYGLYLDILTGCYITIVITALPFFKESIAASTVGLAITQLFALSGVLQWCAAQWSELEMHMTSAERLLEYTKVELENKSGITINDWPNSGKIVYKNVNLEYDQNSKQILRNLSFTIEHGEKVGIVGRTGAGKSSVISALFRLYPFEGTITVDDVETNTVKVEELRSKISIIPQQPTLFYGTVRSNLDPNGQYGDKELWNALEQVEMKNKIDSLDLITSEENSTFSIGEKQLICLARVVLQDNFIVILDEATANIDTHTECLIYETIKRLFASKTIIIIAHRLHTVMDCDKVLVMDSGRIVECDDPKNLLNKTQGMFYGMVKQAGLLQQKNVISN